MSLESLAEDTYLLNKVCPTPEDGHDNFESGLMGSNESQRTLSFKHELCIADKLSFLSAYTDDNSKVSALCVEELPGGAGLLINVVTNSGELEKLKTVLKNITAILMKEAKIGQFHTSGTSCLEI